MNDANDHIGYLIVRPGSHGVCCEACLEASDLSPRYPVNQAGPRPVKLYRVNVAPYKQTCHGCGKTLVEPETPKWPELYGRTEWVRFPTGK